VTEVHVPKMGMSTIEVEIVELLVAVGDAVAPDTAIAVVAGDKAEVEVSAGVSGVVRELLVRDGQECEVGQVIARIA
jgi:pyruvate/2-oxoglutarate dehydrogenase complex dihydrolipoamide acyltransferase (E2) component